MCNRALTWAFEQDLRPIEKLVLVAIANMVNGKTEVCWPSQETLAKRCSLCRQRVNKALAILRDKGLVLIEKWNRSCRYRVNMSPVATSDMSPSTTYQPTPVVNSDTSTRNMSPIATSPVVSSDTNLKEPKKEDKKEDSVANATGTDAPSDPLKDMWRRGKAVLGQSAGGLIGKARRDHGDEAVIAAIGACEREGPVEPVEFFIGSLRQHSRKRSAVEKLYQGAMEAADELDRLDRWEQQQARNGRADYPPVGALLDGR